MSTISQTPLKGIPYGKQHKPQPVHLKGIPQPDENEEEARYGARDLGKSDPDGVKKGLFDWIFGSSGESTPPLAEPGRFQLGGASLKGHLASDLKHSRYETSRYEIRTYMPVEGGQVASVDFRDLLAAKALPPYPSQHFVITSDQVDKAKETTGQERQRQLDDLSQLHSGDRVVPKDATLNPTNYSMYLRSTSDVSTRYAQQLSQIGRIEGFHVVAGIQDGSEKSFRRALDGYNNISLMEVPHGEVWTEDYSEPSLGGGQITPAIFDDWGGGLVSDAIREGRRERFEKLGLTGDFAYHGAVNQGKYQQFALARGTATQGHLRQALSYLEGGNIYTGSRANGDGYVLVGKDSFHVSKRLLEKQTGREWKDEEVSRVIAADLGLKTENVVPIEQPGAFHLDMRLTAVAPGEIMLNDSKAAAEQQISWLKQDVQYQLDQGKISEKEARKKLKTIEGQAQDMRAQAASMAPYEELTRQDLEAAGFKVHRVGGAFVDPEKPSRDTANYFNARHGTNEQGERFTILMGGQPHEEAFMAQKVLEFSQGSISRIHFMDPSVTQKTLDLWGGLKCRTKPEGDLISDNLLHQPAHSQLQPG